MQRKIDSCAQQARTLEIQLAEYHGENSDRIGELETHTEATEKFAAKVRQLWNSVGKQQTCFAAASCVLVTVLFPLNSCCTLAWIQLSRAIVQQNRLRLSIINFMSEMLCVEGYHSWWLHDAGVPSPCFWLGLFLVVTLERAAATAEQDRWHEETGLTNICSQGAACVDWHISGPDAGACGCQS